MNCDEVRESLAAYALGILEPAEHAAVEQHLLDCRDHDDELVELRATGMGLALLRDDPAPSPTLRARIAAIPDAAPSAPSLPQALPFEPGRPRRGVPFWAAAAAAMLLVATFGAGWYAGTRPAPTAAPERFALVVQAGAQLVRLDGVRGADAVTVTMQGLPPAPDGSNYQVWSIRNGRWNSLGACNTNANGWWKGDFPGSVEVGDEVAITVEPEGGSAKPTGAAILRTKF